MLNASFNCAQLSWLTIFANCCFISGLFVVFLSTVLLFLPRVFFSVDSVKSWCECSSVAQDNSIRFFLFRLAFVRGISVTDDLDGSVALRRVTPPKSATIVKVDKKRDRVSLESYREIKTQTTLPSGLPSAQSEKKSQFLNDTVHKGIRSDILGQGRICFSVDCR